MWYSQILKHCKNTADICSQLSHCVILALARMVNRPAIDPLSLSSPGTVPTLPGGFLICSRATWVVCPPLSHFSYLFIIFVNLSCMAPELQKKKKEAVYFWAIRFLRDTQGKGCRQALKTPQDSGLCTLFGLRVSILSHLMCSCFILLFSS